MKKNLLNICMLSLTFLIGFGFNQQAISSNDFKIATVDINKLLTASPQANVLKNQQSLKLEELQTWIETARLDVQKQSSVENQEKLAKKYESEYLKKQELIKKDYAQKLAEIDANIALAAQKCAKENGYKLVLTKSSVLFGGDDITATIIKSIK